MAEFVSKEEALSRLGEVLKAISTDGGPCYITVDGRARAVLLDIDRYHSLMDAIESMEASPEHHADLELIERLIASEARKRKKSIRYFGLRSKELD